MDKDYYKITFSFQSSGKPEPEGCYVIDRPSLAELHERLDKESDRGLVLIYAAMLDDLLTDRLKGALGQGDKRTLGKLFDGFGPFSSFSAKIDTLYCLGLLPKKSRDELHIVRRIRNHCAHNWADFQFARKLIRSS